jgi:hypothetical protein
MVDEPAAATQPNDAAANRQGREGDPNPVYRTAAELLPAPDPDAPEPIPGLTQSPGLVEIPGSTVPGATHNHVVGPGQAPVDPIAAGLDTAHVPASRNEERVTTDATTGETILPGKDPAVQLPAKAADAPAAATAAETDHHAE